MGENKRVREQERDRGGGKEEGRTRDSWQIIDFYYCHSFSNSSA